MRLNKEELKYFSMAKRSVKRSIKNNKLLNFDDLNFRIIRFDKEEDKSASAFFGCDTNMNCYIGVDNILIKNSYEDYRFAQLWRDGYEAKMIVDELKKILYHEYAHYLVFKYSIDINCFSLPTESKSEVAYKSEEEDFCEAFADYMIKNENTIERNIAIEKILQIYN